MRAAWRRRLPTLVRHKCCGSGTTFACLARAPPHGQRCRDQCELYLVCRPTAAAARTAVAAATPKCAATAPVAVADVAGAITPAAALPRTPTSTLASIS